jgi:hypothetical protein
MFFVSFRRVFDSNDMLQEGKWLSPPPEYPPIRTETSTMNLMQFIDMENANFHGTVMNETEFIKFFS